MLSKPVSILFIYIASCLYTFASFYHLRLKNWTFWRGYMIAMPLVFIEYIFNIYGNKFANMNGLNVIQIMMLIIAFDIMNIWLINIFILQNKIVMWRELLSLLFLGGAIALSSNMISMNIE